LGRLPQLTLVDEGLVPLAEEDEAEEVFGQPRTPCLRIRGWCLLPFDLEVVLFSVENMLVKQSTHRFLQCEHYVRGLIRYHEEEGGALGDEGVDYLGLHLGLVHLLYELPL